MYSRYKYRFAQKLTFGPKECRIARRGNNEWKMGQKANCKIVFDATAADVAVAAIKSCICWCVDFSFYH